MAGELADKSGALYARYNTFSGTDMVVTMLLPDQKPFVLGQCSTLSYSIFRDKVAVKTMGRINVRGFTKGTRTVGGTAIFTVFDQHVVNQLRQQFQLLHEAGRLKSDELPPFDLILTGANEFGATASMRIYGVTVIEEGMTLSVEDIFTENVWQYQARDIRLLENFTAVEGQLPFDDTVASARTRDGTDVAQGVFSVESLAASVAARQYDADLSNRAIELAREAAQLAERRAAIEAAAGLIYKNKLKGPGGKATPAPLDSVPQQKTPTAGTVVILVQIKRKDGKGYVTADQVQEVWVDGDWWHNAICQPLPDQAGAWLSPEVRQNTWTSGDNNTVVKAIPKDNTQFKIYNKDVEIAQLTGGDRVVKVTLEADVLRDDAEEGWRISQGVNPPSVRPGYPAPRIDLAVKSVPGKRFPSKLAVVWWYEYPPGIAYIGGRITPNIVSQVTQENQTVYYDHHLKSFYQGLPHDKATGMKDSGGRPWGTGDGTGGRGSLDIPVPTVIKIYAAVVRWGDPDWHDITKAKDKVEYTITVAY